MARYRIIQTCFLQPSRTASASTQQPGTEIDFDGMPGPSLLPLDDEARAMMAAVLVEKGLRGDHNEINSWARAIGVAPVSVADSASKIENYIAQHHPDPRTRERYQRAP